MKERRAALVQQKVHDEIASEGRDEWPLQGGLLDQEPVHTQLYRGESKFERGASVL
jgi:hypothetical protein